MSGHEVVLRCKSCHAELAHRKGRKVKIVVRQRLVAVNEDGSVEMSCHECRSNVILPLRWSVPLDTSLRVAAT